MKLHDARRIANLMTQLTDCEAVLSRMAITRLNIEQQGGTWSIENVVFRDIIALNLMDVIRQSLQLHAAELRAAIEAETGQPK